MTNSIKMPVHEQQQAEAQTEPAKSGTNVQVILESDRDEHQRELRELRTELLEQPETEAEEGDPV